MKGTCEELTPAQLLGKGLQMLDQHDIRRAYECFRQAFEAGPPAEIAAAVQSYLGYTMAIVTGRESEALRLMHSAVNQEFYRPDFFLNLGKIYWERKGNRKQALNALFNGLRHCPNDPEITKFLREMGTRRKPAVTFLARGNFINRWLGKRSYRKTRRSHSISSLTR